MTREEKVNLLNELLEIEEKNDIGNLTSTDRREFQQWVEDLEQEPVLDKIRAEIEQEQDDFMDDNDHDECVRFGLKVAYQIIDKYRGEDFNE